MPEIKLQLPPTIAANVEQFTGRTWLLPPLLEWLEHGDQRIFLLTGGPGTGKSMISAWLAGQGPAPADPAADEQLARLRGLVRAIHFCQANSRSNSPLAFAENIADQLTRNVKGFGGALAATLAERVQINLTQQVGTAQAGASVTGVFIGRLDLGALGDELSFDRAFTQPVKKLYESGYDKPLLLLVDALDEAETYTGKKKLPELLAGLDDLPSQIRIVATTRTAPRILKHYRRSRLFDLIQDAPRGVDDMTQYILERLSVKDGLDGEQRNLLAARLSHEAKGVFLYAHLVLEDLLPRLPQIPDLETYPLPAGLSGQYHDFLTRELGQDEDRWDKIFKPILGLIAVAQGDGLTWTQLADISGVKDEGALRACKQYLAGELLEGPFRVFHRSFADFLLDKGDVDYHINAGQMNLMIGASYVRRYPEQWDGCDEYGLCYVPDHLIDAFKCFQELGRVEELSIASNELRKLFAGDRFLLAKARRQGLRAATEDLRKQKGLASGGRFDVGVATSEEVFVIRVLLDCIRRPQAWTSGAQPVEALIKEVEGAGAGELLSILSDIKSGKSLLLRDEIVCAPPQAVFDMFAGPAGTISWIAPCNARWRPGPVRAHALRVGEQIYGWRVVTVESGRMVQLQNVANPGMRQHMAARETTDTTSRLVYILVLPLTRWLAVSYLTSVVLPVVLPILADALFVAPPMLALIRFFRAMLTIIAESERDALRRVARLAEAHVQVDATQQKALRQDYTGRSLQVFSGVVLSLVLLLSFVLTNAVVWPLAWLGLAFSLGVSALDLAWLHQAERIERQFRVKMPGASTLRTLKGPAMVIFLMLVVIVILFLIGKVL